LLFFAFDSVVRIIQDSFFVHILHEWSPDVNAANKIYGYKECNIDWLDVSKAKEILIEHAAAAVVVVANALVSDELTRL
jgi:hypothetical protein